jgi:hypothetical protein
MVRTARDASQVTDTRRTEQRLDENTASLRERAINAEVLARTLHAAVNERDAHIADLTGLLYHPDGTHLAVENKRLRDLILTLNANLLRAQLEISNLRRSLDAARANVKRERERNVAQLLPNPVTGALQRWRGNGYEDVRELRHGDRVAARGGHGRDRLWVQFAQPS